MSDTIFFTPGPSQLYPGADQFIQDALREDVGSISHRSKAFEEIYKRAVSNLRQLMDIPDDYHIFFLGSATECWERLAKNCVREKSFHFVNGSFSKRFHQYAEGAGKQAGKEEVDFGKGFDNIGDLSIPSDTEMLAVTHNETSTGVSMPLEDIYTLKKNYPEAIIAVDGVSSLPNPPLDFGKVDSALLSVQKCFGLPAGLGVWFVNEHCVEKAEAMKKEGFQIGPHHDIPSLLKKAKDNQTPSTPNVLNIYLLSKVAGAMLEKGINTIRKETRKKSDMLYDYLNRSKHFKPFVETPEHQSETVVVANTPTSSLDINKYLEPFNMQVGTGYGGYKEQHIRIANFPAHSVEKTEELVQRLEEKYG